MWLMSKVPPKVLLPKLVHLTTSAGLGPLKVIVQREREKKRD